MEPTRLVSMAMTENSSAGPLSPPEATPLPGPELITLIIPPFIFVLSATGVLGNSFVLLVFLLHRGRWSVPEIYLGNLALADLLLLACLPFWAVAVLRGYDWPFGLCLCKIVNLSVVVNFYTSMYLLSMVSVDRYLALVKTMHTLRLRRKCHAKAVCLALWALGVLMGVPTMVSRKVKYMEEYQISACVLDYPTPSWKTAHEVLLVAVGFVLPLLVIVFCSWNIFRALNQRRASVSAQGAADRKPTVLVYAVTVLFLVCWGPFQVFTFLGLLYEAHLLDEAWLDTLHLGDQVSIYLAFLNSALNPVLYVFSGQYFRRKVSAICWRSRYGRRGSDMSMHQRSLVSTYVNRTEQIKPVVI